MISRFRHILCPVDFSRDARTALRHGAAIARRSEGRLTVLFVNDPLLAAAAAAAYDARELARTTEVELRQFIADAVGPKDAAAVDTLVVLGDPAREISKATRRLRCDLVVLGTRGLGQAGKLFFGSTAERVLRHADVPILVVPHTTARGTAILSNWPTRIVAAIQPGRRATADVRASIDLAAWFSLPLTLVSVVVPTKTPEWLQLRLGAHERSRITSARADLESAAKRAGGRTASVRVLTGNPADQIATAALDTGADLIVLTLRPADRLLGQRQGSVTYRVLCQAAVPVLALAHSSR
jgi:nucleotide-binding universal stress UspA family protein